MVTEEELQKMSPEEIAKLQKENCIFCKIISGKIPSKKVYEDDKVLAILDINPGKKGHVLVMPKEHYPILPLVPPDEFHKLFSATNIIVKAVKEAMLTDKATIFLANGAVAGQQSPHFLFYVFPRENNDALVNFSIKENPAVFEEQKTLLEPLKNNLNIMLSKIMPQNKVEKGKNEQLTPEEVLEKKQEVISQIIEQYPEVRDALLKTPETFKEQIRGNAELEKLFEGIDIMILSKQLKKIYPEDKEKKTPEKTNKEEVKVKEKEVVKESSAEEVDDPKDIEPFLGEHPTAQREAVFKYFESKPKAKQLIIDDPKYFKELLEKRPDVGVIFKNVDINLLSEELNREVKK